MPPAKRPERLPVLLPPEHPACWQRGVLAHPGVLHEAPSCSAWIAAQRPRLQVVQHPQNRRRL